MKLLSEWLNVRDLGSMVVSCDALEHDGSRRSPIVDAGLRIYAPPRICFCNSNRVCVCFSGGRFVVQLTLRREERTRIIFRWYRRLRGDSDACVRGPGCDVKDSPHTASFWNGKSYVYDRLPGL